MGERNLDTLEIYEMALTLGKRVWNCVSKWDEIGMKTIGIQITRSADSIAANIAEGYGRYHYKDRRNFCYYSRGSSFETRTWVEKAIQRKLISKAEGEELIDEIESFNRRLNKFITHLDREIAKGKP